MKFGDAVDVGGEELNCEKFVQLIEKIKGKMSKNNGQSINSKISRKQISKICNRSPTGSVGRYQGPPRQGAQFHKEHDRRLGGLIR